MKKLLLNLLCGLFATASLSAQTYEYKVDLNTVENDELTVELKVPALKQKDLYFQMPAMVPGTYSVYNFGRFVSNFKRHDPERSMVFSDTAIGLKNKLAIMILLNRRMRTIFIFSFNW